MNPPPLPAPVQAIWNDITMPRCQRCLIEPMLQERLAAVAKTYLPFPTIGILPPGTALAHYFLVGSEPSMAFTSADHAAARIAAGSRNFAGGTDESCLQYAMEHWLIGAGEGYYFTDFAKCTMPTSLAKRTPGRYGVCSRYFIRELAVVRPRMIVAVGGDAYKALKEHKQDGWPTIYSVLHYSKQNNPWHQKVARLAQPQHLARVPTLAAFSEFIEGRRRLLGHTTPSRHGPSDRHTTLLAAYSVQFAVIRAMVAGGISHTDKASMVHVKT
jgi:hypothetical protein